MTKNNQGISTGLRYKAIERDKTGKQWTVFRRSAHRKGTFFNARLKDSTLGKWWIYKGSEFYCLAARKLNNNMFLITQLKVKFICTHAYAPYKAVKNLMKLKMHNSCHFTEDGTLLVMIKTGIII